MGLLLLVSSIGLTLLLLCIGGAFAWFLPKGEKKLALLFVVLAVLLGIPFILISLLML